MKKFANSIDLTHAIHALVKHKHMHAYFTGIKYQHALKNNSYLSDTFRNFTGQALIKIFPILMYKIKHNFFYKQQVLLI